MVVVIAEGAFFVRMGNLFNSEILGHPATVPWAFLFPRSGEPLFPRHPAQLYEGIGYFIIFFILFFIYKKYKSALPPLRLTGIAIILIFVMRFIVEFFKEEQAAYTLGIPLNLAHLLSIPFILAGIIILYYSFKHKPKGK
jgi:prolipoprotein diacylglyceryltransferase